MSSINPTPTTIYNIPNDADSNTPRADTSPPHDDVAFTLYSLRASPVNTPPPASPMVTTDQLKDILNSVLNTVKPQSKEDNPFALARLEHYISQGLTLKFDGAQDNLIPWIKKFRALRANAVWREATYLSYEENTYDILSDFTKIKESVIRSQASARWTLPNQAKCLRMGHSSSGSFSRTFIPAPSPTCPRFALTYDNARLPTTTIMTLPATSFGYVTRLTPSTRQPVMAPLVIILTSSSQSSSSC